MKNYEGFIQQILNFIESNELNETEMKNYFKTRLTIEAPQNKKEYLKQLRDHGSVFNNTFQSALNNLLMEINTPSQNNRGEKMYTPLEISKILHITKGNIFHWIDNGLIQNYKQTCKGGKTEIPASEIDRCIEKFPKYKNLWENRIR